MKVKGDEDKGKSGSDETEEVYRLEKYEQDKTHPLKVRPKSEAGAEEILTVSLRPARKQSCKKSTAET